MYSTLAINNSDVAIGTIALTIKRMDLYVEVVEGGRCRVRQQEAERRRCREWKSVRKLVREAKVLARRGAALGACASLCAECTCTCVIRSVQSLCVCVHLCVWTGVLVCDCAGRGGKKPQQGQNVIELVSKWEKEKKRANYRNCRGQFSASLSLPLSLLHC